MLVASVVLASGGDGGGSVGGERVFAYEDGPGGVDAEGEREGFNAHASCIFKPPACIVTGLQRGLGRGLTAPSRAASYHAPMPTLSACPSSNKDGHASQDHPRAYPPGTTAQDNVAQRSRDISVSDIKSRKRVYAYSGRPLTYVLSDCLAAPLGNLDA
ncbi:hypothetical protein HZH66_007557 [Vespula vulgaris]|uniref:Uncharacterized protein n=1 Tax=Vespula vulgaris TaxID=7454 RepID=A0A834N5P5_VESVU|nr:hypothetical protein HZH66_007557 [Vespula vulgaris]